MAGSRSRKAQSIPLLSHSFRPFFLLAAVQAALSILVWLPAFYGELALSSAFAPRDWHVHEMLYGFLPAVITGFLFTAIPNWTGRLPIQGTPLAALAIVWLAGRIAVTISAELGWAFALAVDAAFLALVVVAALREIAAGNNWRNLPVVMLVLLLLAGNIAFHLEAHLEDAADYSIRIGISVVVLLISLIGGRIIPSFTRNWLVKMNPGRLPVPFGRFDGGVIALSALALVCWIASPLSVVTGLAMALAGLLHVARLVRWAGDRTARMAGAAGVMTLAVMTRASLGHTGQPLTASAATHVIYAAIIVAALARVCAVVWPAHGDALLHVAAFGWVTAFAGFAIAFGPLLVGGRWRALAIPRAAVPAR
jgi:uncharacterized protein involved in response to NO